MITQNYTLSLQPGGVPSRIPCVQGDASSRTISLSLSSGGTSFTPPTGAVATFDGTKPDGKSFSVSGTISGSTVSVTLTAQMTAVAGEIPCRLTLVSNAEILGTAEVLLVVSPAAIPTNPDLSDSDMSAFTTLKNAAAQSASAAANSAAAAAEQATAAANSASAAANSATAASTAAAGKADLAVPTAAGNLAKLTALGNLADSGFAVAMGSWTPTVSGASGYTLQTGRYAQIGDMAIVSFSVYGTFSGSKTARIAISGCPLTPADGMASGGGNLSGYTAASNVFFCGWQGNTDGKIYAVGQETGTTETVKWGKTEIYQKTAGEFFAGGTIAFRVADATNQATQEVSDDEV